jgi:alpha-tubulin suppressor-like RCC1 family protein
MRCFLEEFLGRLLIRHFAAPRLDCYPNCTAEQREHRMTRRGIGKVFLSMACLVLVTVVGSAAPARADTNEGSPSARPFGAALSAGDYHSCAVVSDGTVHCWGDNRYGQLGDGTFTKRATPVVVNDLANAVAVSAGNGFTCALLGDGTVRCWGKNDSGELGDGTFTSRTAPVAVSGLAGAVAVSAGDYHGCALLGDGSVRCWGYNRSGGLGDGTTVTRATPAAVSGLAGAVAVTTGGQYSCALLGDGTVRC